MVKKKTPFGKKARKPSSQAKKRTPRTRLLPGMEDKRIEAVTEAALGFKDADEAVKTAAGHRTEAKDDLIEAMKEAGLTVYRDSESDLFVKIEPGTEKVKVLVGEAAAKESGEDDRPIGEGTMETAPAGEEPA